VRNSPRGASRRTRIASSLLATAAATIGMVAIPATAAHAASGEVCMFISPDGAMGAGHVGWGYRWDTAALWDFGATVGSGDWRENGSFDDMLNAFRAGTGGDHYTAYRCDETGSSDQADASHTADLAYGEVYHLFWNNCLTRSIRIFKSYDNSGGLNGMDDGSWTSPNTYFNDNLNQAGFSSATSL
jgi:hypothetical protein